MSLLYRRRILLHKKKSADETYMTTLFTDGTFIINEKESDREANIALYGAVTNEYPPLSYDQPYEFTSTSRRPWHNKRTSIKQVEFGSTVEPTSTMHWFNGCTNLISFDSTNLDTSKVKNMSSMFNNCNKLPSLDLSNFNTSNVTNMSSMFYNCDKLTSLDVSSFDTSSVTNMSNMFYNCSALTSLDVTNFNTSKVTNMSGMFDSCKNLVTIYASNLFTVTIVTSSSYMFRYCYNIVGGSGTTYLSSNYDKTRAKIDGGSADPGYFTAKP